MVELFANSGDPDKTSHSMSSDLGLHCLPNTLLGVSRLQWVNIPPHDSGRVLFSCLSVCLSVHPSGLGFWSLT